jgi:hypothetical protein
MVHSNTSLTAALPEHRRRPQHPPHATSHTTAHHHHDGHTEFLCWFRTPYHCTKLIVWVTTICHCHIQTICAFSRGASNLGHMRTAKSRGRRRCIKSLCICLCNVYCLLFGFDTQWSCGGARSKDLRVKLFIPTHPKPGLFQKFRHVDLPTGSVTVHWVDVPQKVEEVKFHPKVGRVQSNRCGTCDNPPQNVKSQ